MSVFRPLVHYGLRPLFVAWKNSVGPDVAAKTRVSVIGGLYMQAIGVRATTVSLFLVALPRAAVCLQLCARTSTS